MYQNLKKIIESLLKDLQCQLKMTVQSSQQESKTNIYCSLNFNPGLMWGVAGELPDKSERDSCHLTSW